MTAREAYLKVRNSIIGVDAMRCFEYDTLFTFQLIPENLDSSRDPSRLLGNMISVDKRTGGIRDFKPFIIPYDEYRRGIEIRDYK